MFSVDLFGIKISARSRRLIVLTFNPTASFLPNALDNSPVSQSAYLENPEVLLRFFSKNSESQ